MPPAKFDLIVAWWAYLSYRIHCITDAHSRIIVRMHIYFHVNIVVREYQLIVIYMHTNSVTMHTNSVTIVDHFIISPQDTQCEIEAQTGNVTQLITMGKGIVADLREGKSADSGGKIIGHYYVLLNSISVISGQIGGEL